MMSKRATLSSIAVLVLAGCATMQVRNDQAPDADLGRLTTYAWSEPNADFDGHPTLDSPLLETHIRSTVDSILASRGYRHETTETPDFRVATRVKAEQDVRSGRGYRGYGGYSPYFRYGHGGHRHFGSFGYDPYYGGTASREYLRGTLVLDIIDGRTEELVWRGWAEDLLDHNPRPERVRQYVELAIGRILEHFPAASAQPRGNLVAP